MNDLVERSVFGKTITKPVYVTEAEARDMLKELLQEALCSHEKAQIEIKSAKSGKS
jgi:L-amino acid N-acyltransferase YncA